MYRHQELNNPFISLHDCRAEKMNDSQGVLSFCFPDGFWVMAQHPENESKDCVRTDEAQVDIQIIDEEIDGVEIYLFREDGSKKVIREEWELENFIHAVNDGAFQVEFITRYESYQSVLYKCWVWFDTEPYHYECEIILHTENITYHWNQLRYDCAW